MDLLVLGGTGFLSSALVAEAVRAGHVVTTVTRGRSSRPVPPGVETLVANRSEPDQLRAALAKRTWDVVIDAILYRPDDARTVTELLGGSVGRYVFISTDFVYGGEPRVFPLNENAPRHALNTYGQNKAACEDVFFEAWEREQFPATILRPPHILGAGGLLGTGSLQGRDPWLLWRLRTKQPLLLLDNGALLIQPVHRDDIARACLAVARSPQTPGRAYNLAGPDAVTTRRYYELVAEIAGAPAPDVLALPSEAYCRAFPDRAPFAQNRVYGLDRVNADAGFVPTVHLPNALAEVVADLDARGPGDGEPPQQNEALHARLREQVTDIAEALGAV